MGAYGLPVACVKWTPDIWMYLLERNGNLRMLSWGERVPFMDQQLDESFLAACGIQAVS
jgi:hypothetical protein